jgi:hypothetical protein
MTQFQTVQLPKSAAPLIAPSMQPYLTDGAPRPKKVRTAAKRAPKRVKGAKRGRARKAS